MNLDEIKNNPQCQKCPERFKCLTKDNSELHICPYVAPKFIYNDADTVSYSFTTSALNILGNVKINNNILEDIIDERVKNHQFSWKKLWNKIRRNNVIIKGSG